MDKTKRRMRLDDLEGSIVYLSGPMTGRLNFNFAQFDAWAAELRNAGAVVLNPAETAGGATHLPREWYFRMDFAVIGNAEAVVLMPGWDNSRGATIEALYANELGVPLYQLDTSTDGIPYLTRIAKIYSFDVRYDCHLEF